MLTRDTRRTCSFLAVLLMGLAAAPALVSPAGAQMPAATAPPPSADYRLRPGDEVGFFVLPRKEFDCTGTVTPDGLLHLPNIGTVKAGGLTAAELAARVQTLLKSELRAPQVTATILRLSQPIQPPKVAVIGAVVTPGQVEITGQVRVRKAIELAGGAIKDADLSRVVLTRRNVQRTELDLSDPARVADPQANPTLEEGDTVMVPLRARIEVTVVGAVEKPGALTDQEADLRLRKAVELAGGATKEADLSRVAVVHRDLTRTIVDLSREENALNPAHNPVLRNGDSVEVPLLFVGGVVSITGAVTKPGSFPLAPGWSLEDLIGAADKLTPLADFEQVVLRRRDAPERVVNLVAQQQLGVNGRIPLQPGDEVFVPEFAGKILLVAPIPNPGLRGFKPGQTLATFFTDGNPDVGAALDPTRADLKNIRLIRNGKKVLEVRLVDLPKVAARRGDLATLRNGDIIVIPGREPENGSRFNALFSLPFIGDIANLLLR